MQVIKKMKMKKKLKMITINPKKMECTISTNSKSQQGILSAHYTVTYKADLVSGNQHPSTNMTHKPQEVVTYSVVISSVNQDRPLKK